MANACDSIFAHALKNVAGAAKQTRFIQAFESGLLDEAKSFDDMVAISRFINCKKAHTTPSFNKETNRSLMIHKKEAARSRLLAKLEARKAK